VNDIPDKGGIIMPDKKDRFIEYLDRSIRDTLEEEKMFILDERKDEANLIKVRSNILNIFKTVFTGIIKLQKQEEEMKASFLEKLETIPENWRSSYENAKLHQDAVKVLIEDTKLQTTQSIRSKFLEIWEDKHD
jgi:hypothetical protein